MNEPWKILVVEDQYFVAVDCELHLREAGYACVGLAATGEEAFEIAASEHPDLIIMDINLDGSVDGVQTAILIQERLGIHCIFASAHADAAVRARAAQARPLGWLDKPYSGLQLIEAVRQGIEKVDARPPAAAGNGHGTSVPATRYALSKDTIMQSDQLTPGSFWSATSSPPEHPPLSANVTADVCVIGAGIGGLTTAYLLAKQGLSVALVEALGIGAGETSHTTAHIAVPDDRFFHIEKSYGGGAARAVATSFAAATDFIESTVRDEQIQCAFERVDGFLFSCASDPHAALQKEYAAATRAGVLVSWEKRLPVESLAPGPCLRFAQQAQFHPLHYLNGLAGAFTRHRGAVFCGTRALGIEETEDGVVVMTATGKIHADAAVVATNTPFHDRTAIHLKQFAYQSYVIAATVPEGLLPRVLIWDDGDPYHYVRLASDPEGKHELLIVGGADHKTGQESHPELHYRDLEVWLRERFPQAGPLAYRWSGEVMEPLDGIAFLGRHPGSKNIYVITGDSGNGMTHATIGGMLVTDMIMGRQNPWLTVYDPARKPLRETLRFIREQSNIAAQYTDWVSGGDERAADLQPGEGALIRSGLKRLAVYRDEAGALHAHSAKCTHLGCVVHWNAVEKTWDCPCHGSRFNAYGGVLHGPAVSALAPVDDDAWTELLAPVAPTEQSSRERQRKT